jgi:hypothetical protein
MRRLQTFPAAPRNGEVRPFETFKFPLLVFRLGRRSGSMYRHPRAVRKFPNRRRVGREDYARTAGPKAAIADKSRIRDLVWKFRYPFNQLPSNHADD